MWRSMEFRQDEQMVLTDFDRYDEARVSLAVSRAGCNGGTKLTWGVLFFKGTLFGVGLEGHQKATIHFGFFPFLSHASFDSRIDLG